jgi:hypothetical protein
MNKLPLLLSALLLSVSPAVAQYNAEDQCIMNKRSELQLAEEYLVMAIQKSQQPEMVADLVRQMEVVNHFPKGLSERDKNGIAYKLMTDTIAQIKSKIEVYETLPDCAELQ